MKRSFSFPRLVAGALVLSVLLGVAYASSGQQGSQSDPLVTLSYIEKQVKPAIMEQLGEDLTQQTQALTEKFQDEIASLKKEVEISLSQGGQGAGFTVVTLSPAQRIHALPGCEILVRSGSIFCFSEASPSFMDLTSGGTLESGMVPLVNHLYVAPAQGSGFASNDTSVLLVRGEYTLG